MDQLIDLLTGEQAKRVFEEHWPWMVAGLLVIAKWVRKSTLHWTLWPGVTRVLGLAIEILDMIHLPKLKPSKGDLAKADNRAYNERDPKKRKRITDRVAKVKKGDEGYPKADGVTIMEVVAAAALVALAAYALLLVINCGTWTGTAKNAITTGHEAGIALRQQALPQINRQCSAAVTTCVTDGRQDNCHEYDQCESMRTAFGQALVQYQQSLRMLMSVVDTMEKIGVDDG